MINITDKARCCGCSACTVLCPVKALEMKTDEEGFSYPEADMNKCMRCKTCDKVCIYNQPDEERDLNYPAYACKNTNHDQRLKSSSGGVFYLLCENILENGGAVFGAGFETPLRVTHMLIEKKKISP